MPSTADRLFRAAPRPLKDLLCTAYGWRVRRRRYGGAWQQLMEQAAREERLSADELRALSLRRLRATLVRSGSEVPYYRQLFRERGIDAETLPLPDGLQEIPILDKQSIRERPGDFLSEAVGGPLEYRDTSGTSGSPLRVAADLSSLRHHYSYYEHFRQQAGSARGHRRATFNGRILWPSGRRRPPFWVREWSENNFFFSVYHMSPDTMADYVRCLVRYHPEEIHAYPSAVLTLARFARQEGLELPRPRCILTSAETLTGDDRQFLQEAFGAPVFNQYGNAEMTIFAGDCSAGNLHLNTGYSFVEIPGDHGPGKRTGDVLTTGYVNRAMPLIRYRVGDTVAESDTNCTCGITYPVLREVTGRTDDLLLLPDGRVVGRLDPVFKGLDGLAEVQIVQETRERVLLKVVPDRDYGETAEAALVRALADRLGPSAQIRVELVDEIPRTSGGKFRAVVRLFDA